MRTYPPNSPQAAARIVALTLVSDGQLKRAELEALAELQAERRLGLADGELRGVVHAFCEDLLADSERSNGGADCSIAPETIDHLLADVDDPQLRRTLLRLCAAVVHADRHVHDGESIVMLAAIDRWQLSPDVLAELSRTEPSWTG